MTLQRQREKWARLIQRRRQQLDLSQEELARTGVCSLSYIQKIENAMKGNQIIVDKIMAIMTNGRRKSA